jgi:flagellar motor switch protein FliG
MDARSIAEMIRSEHPQIIAITVSLLEHELAADVLRHFPKELRPDVIMRIANLEIIQPEALEELEVIMKKQFADNSALKSTDVGGVTRAAKIMNFAKAEMESQIMNSLMDADEALTGRIKDNMFIFANLQSLDARSLQTLIRNIETEKLMIALKGTDDAVKNAFVENMSARGGELFLDDMEASGPVRISDVEEAQKEILLIARRLSDAGEVMLGNGADFV